MLTLMDQTKKQGSAPREDTGRQDKPLYLVIVDDVIQKIHDGQYSAGDQLGSLNDLCAHYDVSMATAHRSMTELAKRGVIKTIPRKGAYVQGVPTPPPVRHAEQVERIILVESLSHKRDRKAAANKHPGFTDHAVDAIVRMCRQHQLALEFQFIPLDHSATPRLFFTPRSGDAIIAVGNNVSVALLSHLATPNVPSVVVDASSPNSHCVLTDNYSGMQQITQHLHDLGHRRVVVASWFATRLANSTNENERRDALLHHAGLLAMDAISIDTGNWDDLFTACQGQPRRTAVIFTRDDPALTFIDLARQRGLRVPEDLSVVGFDDWSTRMEALNHLTTVHVDTAKLGQAAMEIILSPQANRQSQLMWRRVAPQLMVRHSTAKAAD